MARNISEHDRKNASNRKKLPIDLFDSQPSEGATSQDPNKDDAEPVEEVEVAPPAPPVPIRRYRLPNGGRFIENGLVYNLKVGKIVSTRTHDVELLRRQKLVLEDLGDEEEV